MLTARVLQMDCTSLLLLSTFFCCILKSADLLFSFDIPILVLSLFFWSPVRFNQIYHGWVDWVVLQQRTLKWKLPLNQASNVIIIGIQFSVAHPAKPDRAFGFLFCSIFYYWSLGRWVDLSVALFPMTLIKWIISNDELTKLSTWPAHDEIEETKMQNGRTSQCYPANDTRDIFNRK